MLSVMKKSGLCAAAFLMFSAGAARVFLMTMPATGTDPAGEKPALTFTPYEKQHRLAGFWESESQGYAIVG